MATNPGYVYIIAEKTGSGGFTDYYKVGSTENLDERLSKLQIDNPNQLEYWEQVKVSNMQAAEVAAHNAVKRKYMTNEQGRAEWYGVPPGYKDDFITRIRLSVRDYITTN